MKSPEVRLILLLAVALPAWYFTDMESTSRLESYVFPIITFVCFLLFCLWVIGVFARMGGNK
jgi:hypothetical protein